MTIIAYVFPGIETIRLSRPWIRDVSLMSDSAQRYYIPVTLTVDGVNEEALEGNQTQVPLSRREVNIATSLGLEYGDDSGENHRSDRNHHSLTDSRIVSNGEPSLNKHEPAETRQYDEEGKYEDSDEDEYDDGGEGEYDDGDEDKYDGDDDEDGGAGISYSDLAPLADLHQSRNYSTQATESPDSTQPHEARFDRDATLEIDELEVSTAVVYRLC